MLAVSSTNDEVREVQGADVEIRAAQILALRRMVDRATDVEELAVQLAEMPGAGLGRTTGQPSGVGDGGDEAVEGPGDADSNDLAPPLSDQLEGALNLLGFRFPAFGYPFRSINPTVPLRVYPGESEDSQ